MAVSLLRVALLLLWLPENQAFLPSTTRCDLVLPQFGCTCYMLTQPVIVCSDLRVGRWLDFSNLGNITADKLDLSGNSFRSIPKNAFGKMTITTLVLTRNTIPFTGSSRVFTDKQKHSLRHLDLSNNNLTEVPRFIRNLPLLQHLRLTGNHFVHIQRRDLSGLSALTYLHLPDVYKLDRNAFRDIQDLHLLEISPHSFELERNGIKKFFGKAITSQLRYIETLVLRGGWFHLRDSFLGSLLSLEYLEISDAHLDDTNFQSPRIRDDYGDLKVLNLAGNTMENVPRKLLSRLEALEELNLSRNLIQQITNREFRRNPLLRALNLSYNALTAIKRTAFVSLSYLDELDLRHNQLIQVSARLFPAQLMDGMTVYLGHNPWPCTCDSWWLARASHSQLLGRPGPLDLFEVAMEIKCDNPSGSNNGTLVYSLYDTLHESCPASSKSFKRIQ